MIRVDFRSDWKEFIERDLTSFGLQYEKLGSLEDNTLRYLNAKRRVAHRTGRKVHESKELCIPKEYSADYSSLKTLIEGGGNLEPYLSRDIQKNNADKNDGLLNAWGIQHLHFRPHGTADVLFVKITDTDIFVIQSLPHGRGHSDVWVNPVLLQILHDNWPQMATGKVVGLHAESLTNKDRGILRQKNVNFATVVSDGKVYLAPGGAVTSSGHCSVDICDADKIFADLDYWQKLVEANEQAFRSALGIPLGEVLSIKMMFEDRECCLYEPARGVRFRIMLQQ